MHTIPRIWLKSAGCLALLMGTTLSSCLKLEESPYKDVWPVIATQTQYRFVNASSGTGTDTLRLYTDLTCSLPGVLSGSTQTVTRGGKTDYVVIQPGYYATGDSTYCTAFSPAAGGSYTITYNKSPVWLAPSISSP